MIYKFINKDNINCPSDYMEVQDEANSVLISLIKEENEKDDENIFKQTFLTIQLDKNDIDDLIIALSNVQREIYNFEKSYK